MSKTLEPVGITPQSDSYLSEVTRALGWYNYEKDKKDARQYLRSYVGRDKGKLVDKLPDSAILCTYGWMARMKANGCVFRPNEEAKLQEYINSLNKLASTVPAPVEIPKPVAEKPGVREYLEDKVKEYLGDLEGVFDDLIRTDKDFNLLKDLQARSIPAPYCAYISTWIKKKAGIFIEVYETPDQEIKTAYGHIGKRKLTSLIKTLNQWVEDVEKYSQFKKANRKPRVKKLKPAGVQVSKLKFKKEDSQFGIKSINPTEIIGSSQVWIFNTKYKKLAVYRSDSRDGIQVKGSSLQNYDPSQCEQKTLRKPQETLKKVIDAGKIQLRKILTDITTASSVASGRINEDCIIVRAIR